MITTWCDFGQQLGIMDDRDGPVCQPTGLSPRNRVPRHVYGPGAILSRMRLVSADQASVELRIARYQFPGRQGQGNRDWDANWLQVAGTVVLADQKTWSFEDPCMTTWEAAELGRWLNAVAGGAVQPSPFGKGQDKQLLVFTEPNVAFSLQERVADRVQVRVHFSLEALPPWLRGAGRPDIFDFFVILDLQAAELRQATHDWTLTLPHFPPR